MLQFLYLYSYIVTWEYSALSSHWLLCILAISILPKRSCKICKEWWNCHYRCVHLLIVTQWLMYVLLIVSFHIANQLTFFILCCGIIGICCYLDTWQPWHTILHPFMIYLDLQRWREWEMERREEREWEHWVEPFYGGVSLRHALCHRSMEDPYQRSLYTGKLNIESCIHFKIILAGIGLVALQPHNSSSVKGSV